MGGDGGGSEPTRNVLRSFGGGLIRKRIAPHGSYPRRIRWFAERSVASLKGLLRLRLL